MGGRRTVLVPSLMRNCQLQRRQLQLVCAPLCSVRRMCSLLEAPCLQAHCGILNQV